MQFRAAVGPVAGSSSAAGGGGAAGYSAAEMEAPDDRVLCQFCGRKFAEKTAERHIPHCESKYKANLMKNGPPRAGGGARRNPSVGMRR